MQTQVAHPFVNWPAAAPTGPTPLNQPLTFNVVLKPKVPLPPLTATSKPMSRQELASKYGADPTALAAVAAHYSAAGLMVATNPLWRTVRVSGTVGVVAAATHVQFEDFQWQVSNQGPFVKYRGFTGIPWLPAEIAPYVMGIVGLDNRPLLPPSIPAPPRTATGKTSGSGAGQSVQAVAAAYGFPSAVTGAGQCVAAIAMQGTYTPTDIATFFGATVPHVVTVPVGGGNAEHDWEITLDVEVLGSVAPGATIAVYVAPESSGDGWHNTIETAIHDTTNNPSVLSISFAIAETNWDPSARAVVAQALADAAALGINTFVAVGENGIGNLMVTYPATDPNVLGCGGTLLTIANGAIQNEECLQNTNGGFSACYAPSDWQVKAGIQATGPSSGRGTPDIAANGAAYQLFLGGTPTPIGGTSAATPLWAGLVTLINSCLGYRAHPLQRRLPSSRRSPVGVMESVQIRGRDDRPISLG